ncbi:MAG: hypothetical protein ABSC03_05230 [Verrucomicrobiota bacterium]|jgi:hypothetical protein
MVLLELLNWFRTLLYYLAAVCVPLLHVLFAVAVWRDSRRWGRRGGRTVLVAGWVWTLATLVFGLLTVALYWVVHHSTLRVPVAADDGSAQESPTSIRRFGPRITGAEPPPGA